MLSSALRTSATLGFGRRAVSSIALKYSNAVYSAALSRSPQALLKVQYELGAISKSIHSAPDLKAFVTNPTLSAKDRAAGLSALFAQAEGVGPKREPLLDITKNLFTVLAENGRLSETPGVIEGFNALVSKHKGEVEVTVTSAAPLPREAALKLETILKQSQTAQQAKSLQITNKVGELCVPSAFTLVHLLQGQPVHLGWYRRRLWREKHRS